MRIYVPKQDIQIYADQWYPQKPITIPKNPNIKFKQIVKKAGGSPPVATLEQLKASMINPLAAKQEEEVEEYINSAMLTYIIGEEERSLLVTPSDWIVVYADGMVVVKKHEQFVREYDEFNPYLHQSSQA